MAETPAYKQGVYTRLPLVNISETIGSSSGPVRNKNNLIGDVTYRVYSAYVVETVKLTSR